MAGSIQTLSSYFGIDPKKFKELGVLDAFIDLDSNFFVDPQLIKSSGISEFKTANKTVEKYFRDIIILLRASKKEDDLAWRQARSKLLFKEIRGFGIGTGKNSSDGSGIGPYLCEKLLKRASELIELGVDEPEIFELIGLFIEDFGPDRLSDMTIFITRHHFYAYTERIAKELDIKTYPLQTSERTYQIPYDFKKRKRNFFLPRSVLRKLPIAQSWEDIATIAAFNSMLRTRLNALVGKIWKRTSIKEKKETLQKLLGNDPSATKVFINEYKNYNVQGYDFDKDSRGEMGWFEAGKQSAENYPLSLSLPSQPKIVDIEKVVKDIVLQFKKNVELNGLNHHLYEPQKFRRKPRNERYAQYLFYAISDTYCKANNIDLNREPNAGSGAVDFKYSRGYNLKCVTEIKLSTNPNIISGYTKQLEKYKASEGSESGIYIIIRVSQDTSRIDAVMVLMEQAKNNGEKYSEVYIIDGRIKPSASKI